MKQSSVGSSSRRVNQYLDSVHLGDSLLIAYSDLLLVQAFLASAIISVNIASAVSYYNDVPYYHSLLCCFSYRERRGEAAIMHETFVVYTNMNEACTKMYSSLLGTTLAYQT